MNLKTPSDDSGFVCFAKMSRDFKLAICLVDEVKAENLEEAKRLLQVCRANPNTVVPELGVAPLHLLAGLENEAFSVSVAAIALLRNAGDPNVRSEEGLTPVHVAAMWGRCKMLELLLSNGGDPYLRDYRLSMTAEEYALKEGQWQAYRMVTTFTVIFEDKDRFAKYLDDEELELPQVSSSLSREEVSGNDYDWISQTSHVLPINEKAIRIIKNHRRQTKIYESPKNDTITDGELSQFGSYKTNSERNQLSRMSRQRSGCNTPGLFSNHMNACLTDKTLVSSRNSTQSVVAEESENSLGFEPKPPKRKRKQCRNDTSSNEMYVCSFSESTMKTKTPTANSFSSSKYCDSLHCEEAKESIPSNRMLCKMSRIFLFMLKKRNVYQRIK